MKKQFKRRKPKVSKKSKMVTFMIFLRRTRNGVKRFCKETITHFNEDYARALAASKHPNYWVSLKPIKK